MDFSLELGNSAQDIKLKLRSGVLVGRVNPLPGTHKCDAMSLEFCDELRQMRK